MLGDEICKKHQNCMSNVDITLLKEWWGHVSLLQFQAE